MQREMFATVDEIGRVCAAEGIDARFHKGGSLWVSTSPAQTPRVREVLDGAAGLRLRRGGLDVARAPRGAASACAVEGCLGGLFSPRYACVHPARLARGLADTVERLGVRIYEGTPALAAGPGGVDTPAGRLSAGAVILATEAYTATLPGHARDVVPMYDFMIATEPLPAAVWDEIGWERARGAQRRQLSVRLRAAHRRRPHRHRRHHRALLLRLAASPSASSGRGPSSSASTRALRRLFPAVTRRPPSRIAGAACSAPPATGTPASTSTRPPASAGPGGYVGDGVATANLAGRTLTDLILRRDSDLVRPAVGRPPLAGSGSRSRCAGSRPPACAS